MSRRTHWILVCGLLAPALLAGCESSGYVHRYAPGGQGSVVASDRIGSRLAVAGTTRQVAARAAQDSTTATAAASEAP